MKKLFIVGNTIFLILNAEAAQRGAEGTLNAGAGRDVTSKEVDEDPVSMEAMASGTTASLVRPSGSRLTTPKISMKTPEFIEKALREPEFFRHAKVLELDGVVEPSQFSDLARALEQFPQLTGLIIFGGLIGNYGIEIITPALLTLPNLKWLELGVNNITTSAGAALKAILGPGVKIFGAHTTFAPEDMTITPKMFLSEIDDLEYFSKVKRLIIKEDFRSDELNLQDMYYLITSIGKLNNLEQIDLLMEKTVFSPHRVDFLIKELSKLNKLKILNLYFINIGSVHISELAHTLEQLSNLETLGLMDTNLGVDGAETLLPTLNNLPRLTYLNFNGNGLGEVAKRNFRAQLKRSIALEDRE